MIVTLYSPNRPPRLVASGGFSLPNSSTGFAEVTALVAQELGCALDLVDVLDFSNDFVAYTIFDAVGEPNAVGVAAVMRWSEHPDAYSDDDDDVIRGPVLLVTKE